MPTPAVLLLIATLLPFAGFVLLLFAGKRLGNPIAGWVGTLFVSIGFVCTLAAMASWFNADPGHYSGSEWGEGYGPINIPIKWLPIGLPASASNIGQGHPGYLDLGIYIDSLTILLFSVMTLLIVLVHIFSIGSMRDDSRFHRFFAFLSLFTFATLALILGGTLLHILLCWELVGLCAYLLIGFWYESPAASAAALKTLVIQRIGDVGFLIGFGILFCYLGNASLPETWAYLGSAGDGHSIPLPGHAAISAALMTMIGICLFVAAMAHSAQFPLQVWLPDTSEAPTPANALIHSATMTAAGVYLTARMFPILSPSVKLFIAIIGLITLTIGALIASVQNDLKRLLAYSTVSQFGFMMLALGIGSWVGGLLHLVTHAFFKCLLFLAAGSVIHAAGKQQNMTRYGGLWRKIPITAIAFGVGVLAMAGTPYITASAGKNMILANAAAFILMSRDHGHRWVYALFFIIPAVVSVLTAFYMARCWMLTFWGKTRDTALCENAREFPVMWAPLCALVFLTCVSGRYLFVQPLLESSIKETQAACHDIQVRDAFLQSRPDFAGFASIWPTSTLESDDYLTSTLAAGEELQYRWLRYSTLAGLVLAGVLYIRGYSLTRWLAGVRPIRWVYRWLAAEMYFDRFYVAVIVGLVWFVARLFAWFDRAILDRIIDRFGQLARLTARSTAPSDAAFTPRAGDAAVLPGATIASHAPRSGKLNIFLPVFMLIAMLAVIIVTILEWRR